MVRSGGITLVAAFLNPELGFLYQSIIRWDTGGTQVSRVLPEQLDPGLLPEADQSLSLTTDTLAVRFKDLDLPRKAIAIQRELIGLHFDFPSYREDAPTKQLGKILVSVQETIDALGQGFGGNATMRGVIPPEILARTETRLIQAAGGSFALEISAAQALDLFGGSLITDALGELVSLLEIGNDVERLREKLIAVKPRAASKYRVFLASLIGAETPLRLEWASPDPTRNKSLEFSLATAAGALHTAEQVTSEVGERRTGVGYFVGVELPRHSFTAILSDDENVYRGRIDEAAMPAAEHITLNLNYRITIRETIEVTSSGEEKLKYSLEAIADL
jgi:hypothetical protein